MMPLFSHLWAPGSSRRKTGKVVPGSQLKESGCHLGAESWIYIKNILFWTLIMKFCQNILQESMLITVVPVAN